MKIFQQILSALVLAVLLTGCDTAEEIEHTSTAMSSLDIGTSDPETVHESELTLDSASDSASEMLYDYEIKTSADGSQYAVIKGFRDDNAAHPTLDWNAVFPKELGGVAVTAFAPYAFQNIPLGNYSYGKLRIAPDIVSIGAHCFENCGLTDVIFEKQDLPETALAAKLTVHERAFAGNSELWGIYFSNRAVLLKNEVFADCAETGYICYMSYQDKTAKIADDLKAYVAHNQWNAVEIPSYYSSSPIVDYPDTPLTLKPEIGNFFQGEDGSDDSMFYPFAYHDDALYYGFPEWYIPCGEFCAMMEWDYELNASSCLVSKNRDYAAENLGYLAGRNLVWAEGADGAGIGESICVTARCGYSYELDLYPKGTVRFLSGDIEPDIYDGYMRYTQICVVNGYAKNQKTWAENGRVKRLLMYVENQPYAYLELEDSINPQYFTLPFDTIKAADGVDIHFRFVIEEVYAGTTYEDTCLTGLVVDFMGRRSH